MAKIPLNLPFGKLRAGSLRKGEVSSSPFGKGGVGGFYFRDNNNQ